MKGLQDLLRRTLRQISDLLVFRDLMELVRIALANRKCRILLGRVVPLVPSSSVLCTLFVLSYSVTRWIE